jgi:DNA-binding CsgD family transcriptional regulator
VSITLSTRDLALLSQTMKVLASPLSAPSRESWRAAANSSLRELIGADSAGFLLPVRDGPFVFSEEHDGESLQRYPDLRPPALEDGRSAFESAIGRGASTLAEIYEGRPERYYASEYYNEYSGPNGAHDSISMLFGVAVDGPMPVAGVQVWLSTPSRRFSERQAALARLAMPALQAGTGHLLQWAQCHTRLLDALDDLGHAVMVVDASDVAVHRTPALERMLGDDGQKETLEAALREFARSLSDISRGAFGDLPPRLYREVATERARYRLSGSLYREPSSADMLALVSLERTTSVMRSESELRSMYRLTRAEYRLVPWLVAGLSSAEIAQRLSISVHTVRRHIESILLKTGTSSRTALVRIVLK